METTRSRALVVVVTAAAVVGVVAALPRSPDAVGTAADGVSDHVDAHRAWLAGDKLDLNAVDARDLARIPGIGDALAGRIITARDARGGFQSLADVDDVPGVGPKMMAKLATFCEVKAAASTPPPPPTTTTTTPTTTTP